MKELETQTTDKELASHAHHKEKVLKYQMHFIKGLILFELDPVTKIVKPAEYKEVYDAETKQFRKEVVLVPGHVYRQFLNIENAIKKFHKYV